MYEQPLICEQCNEPFSESEEAIELFFGQAGVSSKTGLSAVIVDPMITRHTVILHPWCIIEFTQESITDERSDDNQERDIFCAGCEAKLN